MQPRWSNGDHRKIVRRPKSASPRLAARPLPKATQNPFARNPAATGPAASTNKSSTHTSKSLKSGDAVAKLVPIFGEKVRTANAAYKPRQARPPRVARRSPATKQHPGGKRPLGRTILLAAPDGPPGVGEQRRLMLEPLKAIHHSNVLQLGDYFYRV